MCVTLTKVPKEYFKDDFTIQGRKEIKKNSNLSLVDRSFCFQRLFFSTRKFFYTSNKDDESSGWSNPIRL
jgi:hypothetical protein